MESPAPHVLVFPYPIQGHVTAMLKLARLLCLAGLRVTFLNSAHNHRRLLRHSDVGALTNQYPGLGFDTFPDGLPEDHPRSGACLSDLQVALEPAAKPVLREMLTRIREDVTCFIVDGILGFPCDLAEEVGLPVITFRTSSASFFWSCFCIPKLLQAGEIPLRDDNKDDLVKSIPGAETFLRYRDLPRFFPRLSDNEPSNAIFDAARDNTPRTQKAHALILNTFEDLEGPALSSIRTHCNPRVYSLGPLPLHLNNKLNQTTSPNGTWLSSLWQVDRSCLKWLDNKPHKSVVYVSFGSMTILDNHQLKELWAGLVCSKRPFLWVIRPDSITGPDGSVEPGIEEGTRERGCMVSWAPQEEVLAHPAVGGFLTHSGWNLTMESVVAGVPMLCWPYFADQPLVGRCVGEVWKIGLDMKDRCDRETAEKMVNDLMEGKRAELDRSMVVVSGLAKKSVDQGGTSSCNLDRLIEDIRGMARKARVSLWGMESM